MLGKRIAGLIAVVALTLLCACSSGPYSAVFQSYEAAEGSTGLPTGENETGYAFVLIEGGDSDVRAECPFEGLSTGHLVTVEQSADGSFVVTEVK